MAKIAQKVLPLAGVRHTIAVSSAKGGVGKSTVAVNLAIAMASLGQRVGILDADIFGPSIHKMLNLSGKRPLVTADKKLEPLQNYGLKVMSSGFLVPEDQSIVWRGAMVVGAINQLIRDVVWGDLNTLVIDLPPGTGDTHLTVTQQIALAGAVVVSTPQDIALIDAKRGIDMFRKVNVPILGIVENMSYFLCPHCGERSDIFGHGGAEQTATDYKVPFLGHIPLNIDIRTTSDSGLPITISQPNHPAAAPYFALARMIVAALEKADKEAAGKESKVSITMD